MSASNSSPLAVLTLVLGLLPYDASAQNLSFEDNFACSNQSNIGATGGRYGWAANWAADAWTSSTSTGVSAKVNTFGGDYGGLVDAFENFLLTGHSLYQDAMIEARAFNNNQGAQGLVGRYDGSSHYACLASFDSTPGCGGYDVGSGSFLVRYSTYDTCSVYSPVMASSGVTPPLVNLPAVDGHYGVRLEIQGNTITCSFDYNDDGDYSDPTDVVLNYTDPNPIVSGFYGLYAVGTGSANGAWMDDAALYTLDADADGDGVPDLIDPDAFDSDVDDDSISDAVELGMPEYPFDSDGDFVLDVFETDSDNDGLSDWIESQGGVRDTDCDGLPDHRDTDSDGDSWLDSGDPCPVTFGNPFDADGDGLGDACDSNDASQDSDGDGLLDGPEARVYGTDPDAADTDGGGASDGREILDGTDPLDASDDIVPDSDSDGLSDQDEIYLYGTNPFAADTDNDGVDDPTEVLTLGTDPTNDDSDGDGLTDGEEVNVHGSDPMLIDSDGDGLQDLPEVTLYLTDPTNVDSDGDTISDGDEVFVYGTDPALFDSDDDQLSDGVEYLRDTDGDSIIDALAPDDDGDGVLTRAEDLDGDGNPLNDNTDGDGQPNCRDDDDDGDGIFTLAEDLNGNGDYTDDDVDGDTVPSYLDDDEESANQDTDLDGVSDVDEDAIGSNRLSPDSDGDGLEDGAEVGDPANPTDTDLDGFPDIIDGDDDGDGLPTEEELVEGEAVDTDGDTLPDHLDSDRDNDGVSDGRDPDPDARGGDGAGTAPPKKVYGFGLGCTHDAGAPWLAGWLGLALVVLNRPRRRPPV